MTILWDILSYPFRANPTPTVLDSDTSFHLVVIPLDEEFKIRLRALESNEIDLHTCITKCCHLVVEQVEKDFKHEVPTKKLVQNYLREFDQALDAMICSWNGTNLKNEFKTALEIIFQDRWASCLAKSFAALLEIHDRDQQVDAAIQWTAQFFAGADDWNNGFTDHSEDGKAFKDRIIAFHLKVANAFESHLQERLQQEMEAMSQFCDRNPTFVGQLAQQVDAKVRSKTALSDMERRYHRFVQLLASSVAKSWPEIEARKKLLLKCICNGYSLRIRRLDIDETQYEMFKKDFLKQGIIYERFDSFVQQDDTNSSM